MSAQIDSFPDLIRPANQPLIFTISDTGAAPDRYVVQVFEDAVEIAKYYLTPNTNDVVHFDLSEAMRDRVFCDDKIRDESATIHAPIATAFTTGRNGLKKYEVKVGTYIGTTETLNQDAESVYLLDGAEQILDGLHPSFADYYSTGYPAKTWLTDVPAASGVVDMFAAEEDEGVVAFINDWNIITSTSFSLIYTLYNDGTPYTSEFFTLNAANGAQLPSDTDINQKLTFFGVMPQNLDQFVSTSPLSNDWTRYTLVMFDAGGFGSSFLTIHKDCRPVKHNATQLAWTNTRGGWEYLRFDGRSAKTTQTQSKTYRKALGDYDASAYTFIKQARETASYQVTASESYELRNVSFNTQELELLQYAFKSDNVMIRIGTGEWMPVILDTKSYKVVEHISKLSEVSLTATLSQTIKC